MKAEAQEGGVLTSILAATAPRVEQLRAYGAALERAAARAPDAPPFRAALRQPLVAVIAEVKKRSPSSGVIRSCDAAVLATMYAEAGAAAISVLTEPHRFGGSLEDLRRVAALVKLPVLRKDFIIDPLQVFEARAAGAAAILLIVRALSRDRLAELAGVARNVGLAALVEVHDETELRVALEIGADVIGVNARDLETLTMDDGAHRALVPRVPAGLAAVAESGLTSRADVEAVAAAGADAVLVGTAVAGAVDPVAALRPLTTVPRVGRS